MRRSITSFWGTSVLSLCASFACSGAPGGSLSDGNVSPPDMNAAGAPAVVGPDGPGSGGVGTVTPELDPGWVGIHRLNNTEYNNTVRDLLQVTTQPATSFLAEQGLNFDNTASALGMTGAQYEAYFNAAETLATELLGNPALMTRIMTCTPAGASDACATQIVQTFGLLAFRRPLDASEVARYLTVFDAELARSGSAAEAVALTVRAMLASASFLYRIEFDPDPASPTPHALTGYELASRLSYLQWSSMPDQTLFDLAASGEILSPAVLEAQVDRLLTDPLKAPAFVESFAGQWLDIRKLVTHSVTPQVFTTYTAELADAMAAESYAWFNEFLLQNRPISDWFTADFNYVNDVLAEHYGMLPVTGSTVVRVEDTTDQRRGFLGLGAFLTHTSFPSRTSPTLRGVWVISELLCSPVQPPPVVPELAESATPDEAGEADGSENVRKRLERHRADPACASCHAVLDPIGLGLETFDGIGRYRTTYGNGEAIDPAGVLPDGTAFSGPSELATILAADPRFATCMTKKLLTYALGREVEGSDATSLTKIADGWTTRGPTIRNLMKEIVLSDAFRFRRGEAP